MLHPGWSGSCTLQVGAACTKPQHIQLVGTLHFLKLLNFKYNDDGEKCVAIVMGVNVKSTNFNEDPFFHKFLQQMMIYSFAINTALWMDTNLILYCVNLLKILQWHSMGVYDFSILKDRSLFWNKYKFEK